MWANVIHNIHKYMCGNCGINWLNERYAFVSWSLPPLHRIFLSVDQAKLSIAAPSNAIRMENDKSSFSRNQQYENNTVTGGGGRGGGEVAIGCASRV